VQQSQPAQDAHSQQQQPVVAAWAVAGTAAANIDVNATSIARKRMTHLTGFQNRFDPETDTRIRRTG
jgi:hypothetical protein